MILLEICFIIGLTAGLVGGLILFFIIFYDDMKAVSDFNKRQEDYKKRI